MLAVGICDDEIFDLNRLQKLVSNYLISKDIQCTISTYQSGEELLAAARTQTFDVIFLDIDMPGMDGIELGREIWKHNKKIKIIYVTNYAEYALLAIDSTHAFMYLLKERLKYKIAGTLDDVLDTLNETYQKIMLKTNAGNQYLGLNEIFYFEHNCRKINIMTDYGMYQTYATLSELEERLRNYDFRMPHRSFLVNLAKIRCVTNNSIQLNDSQQPPLKITQSYSDEFKKAFQTFVLKTFKFKIGK